MIQLPCALPFNTMTLASIYTLTLFVNNELEIAKALSRHSVEMGLPKHYARWQEARRWNQGQEIFIDKSCLDCEIYFTAILQKMCRCRCSVQASNQTLSKGKAPT